MCSMRRGLRLQQGLSSTIWTLVISGSLGRDTGELTIGPTVHWWKADWLVGGGVNGYTRHCQSVHLREKK